MRHHLVPSGRIPFRSALRAAALPAAAILFCACATVPPLRPEMSHVLAEPDTYRNERVELSGRVVDYEPASGDRYRTLYFTLGAGPEEKIPVFGSGYGADAIAKASDLVGEAFRAGEPLTVVGRLKTSGGSDPGRAELKLESVEFGGRRIDVTKGRKTQPGFEVGGFHIVPSIGISATFSP